ncbi:hypothetical protein [Bacillus thuringiensis]|uniref:hypothetical protein n=1 Tax=Bacillus thuringiensis TaxID=1428 RepID=UPI0021D691C4|nr:hypothetical protein [Bacillus thuringiensis]MCU7666824.1 hypothetical protein [Bacillus thuringiensis]
MKLAVVSGHMYLFSSDFSFTEAELLARTHLNKCNPELRIHVDYQHVDSEGEEDGKEYYALEDGDLIYKEYELGLDELCMNHPYAYVRFDSGSVSGEIYVKEDEIEKGKQLLLAGFKNELNYEMRKLELFMNAVKKTELDIQSHN